MRVPVNRPLLDGNEAAYLAECVAGGWISGEGPFVERLEREFAARCGRRYGIAVSSGSGALDIAVAALGIGPGDEVILPSFTIISCALAVVRAGATPVAVDCDAAHWNMAAAEVEKAITPRTRAIMAVHIYGLAVDMNAIQTLAARHRLPVIEDAAQAIGQTVAGKPCGGFGAVSAFSFYPNKNLTTGEGGMLLTDDPHLAGRCRSLRNLCFQEGRRFVHEELGWNYRMSNLQAALGCAQLERLDAHLERKRRIGALYGELLAGVPVQLPRERTPWTENLYWAYGIVLPEESRLDRDELMTALFGLGIGSRPFFWPMHQQPVFRAMGLFAGASLPVAEMLGRRGLYLPSGLGISDPEIVHVAETVRRLMG
ncbi:MAG: DegT/DnrJ/EryC1/StrS family aminotransferase [Thermodesulfobacteriota bacterium]